MLIDKCANWWSGSSTIDKQLETASIRLASHPRSKFGGNRQIDDDVTQTEFGVVENPGGVATGKPLQVM